jgi:signal transduction histidine kinase
MPSAETKPVRALSRRAHDPFDHQYDETMDEEPSSVSSAQGPDIRVVPIIAHQPNEALLEAMGAMRDPLRRLVPLMAAVLSEVRGINRRARDSGTQDRGYWWLQNRMDERLSLVSRRVDEMWILFENVVATMDGLRRRAGSGQATGAVDTSGNLIDCVLHEMATPAACVRSQVYVAREDLRALGALGGGFKHGGNPMAWEELRQRLRELEDVLNDGVQGAAHVLDVVQSAMLVGEPGPERNAEVDTVIRRVVHLLARRASRSAAIEVEVEQGLYVQARASQVAQVLINLIMNAIQAIEGSSRFGTIVVRAHRHAGSIVIDVCDDGPGVGPNDAERIFEPYVSGRRPGVGSGLGLAISRDIAEAYGGEIQLTSIPGFTTFRLRLPPAENTTMVRAR